MPEENQPSLANRLRYRKDDPRRYLTVPVGERLTEDTGSQADALDDQGRPAEGNFDREAVRKAGGVVPEEKLQ